ncbi:MAG: DUF835 domain-containing protein [Candidatus Methanofastidiosia archaeon]|jgi:hypothetical protein
MPGISAVIVLLILGAGVICAVAVVLFLIFIYTRKQDPAEWDMGVSYLVKEKGNERGLQLFRKLLKDRDTEGMIISRTFPEKLQKERRLPPVNMWWLSREEDQNSINPTSLAKLSHIIRDFIKAHDGAIVFLDGVEYLMMHNGFETSLRFLQALNDLIVLENAILILPVDPSSLSLKQISLLEKEMEIHRLSINVLRLFGEQ